MTSPTMPSDMNSYLTATHSILRSGDLLSALRCTETAVRRYSENPLAWHLHGTVLFRLDRITESEHAFSMRLKLQPDNAVAHYSVGLVLEKKGNTEAAASQFRQALRINPGLSAASSHLAQLDVAKARLMPAPAQLVARTRSAKSEIVTNANVPTMDTQIKAGDVGPGNLVYTSTRLLRSYVGRYVLTLVFLLLGGLVASGQLSTKSIADSLSAVSANGRTLAQIDYARQDSARLATNLRIEISIGFIVIGLLVALFMYASAVSTYYRLYQKRIDITEGIFVRRVCSIWLYSIEDVAFEQGPLLAIAGTGRILVTSDTARVADVIKSGKARRAGTTKKPVRITGLANTQTMENLTEGLRRAVLAQRRSLKGQWI